MALLALYLGSFLGVTLDTYQDTSGPMYLGLFAARLEARGLRWQVVYLSEIYYPSALVTAAILILWFR